MVEVIAVQIPLLELPGLEPKFNLSNKLNKNVPQSLSQSPQQNLANPNTAINVTTNLHTVAPIPTMTAKVATSIPLWIKILIGVVIGLVLIGAVAGIVAYFLIAGATTTTKTTATTTTATTATTTTATTATTTTTTSATTTSVTTISTSSTTSTTSATTTTTSVTTTSATTTTTISSTTSATTTSTTSSTTSATTSTTSDTTITTTTSTTSVTTTTTVTTTTNTITTTTSTSTSASTTTSVTTSTTTTTTDTVTTTTSTSTSAITSTSATTSSTSATTTSTSSSSTSTSTSSSSTSTSTSSSSTSTSTSSSSTSTSTSSSTTSTSTSSSSTSTSTSSSSTSTSTSSSTTSTSTSSSSTSTSTSSSSTSTSTSSSSTSTSTSSSTTSTSTSSSSTSTSATTTSTSATTTTTTPIPCVNMQWNMTGVTVAGTTGTFSTAANHLSQPWNLFVDSNRNMYIADAANHRIQFWPNGASSGTTIAGISGGWGSASNRLDMPSDIFVYSNGNFLVADRNNNRIQFFTSGSTSGTNGVTASTGWGGTGRFYGVQPDPTSRIVASDMSNSALWRNNTVPFGYQGAGGAWNQLNGNQGIAVDSVTGDVYIANTNQHTIVRWTPGNNFVTVVAGTNGVSGNSNTAMTFPVGVRLDSFGNLYVVDNNNHRIQLYCRFPTVSSTARTIAGTGTSGSSATQLTFPTGLALDNDLNLYVADNSNHRIQRFTRIA